MYVCEISRNISPAWGKRTVCLECIWRGVKKYTCSLSISSHPLILRCLPHCALSNSVFCLNLNLSHSLPLCYCLLLPPSLTHTFSHSILQQLFLPHTFLDSASLSLSLALSSSLIQSLIHADGFHCRGSLRSAFKKQRERNVCHFSP